MEASYTYRVANISKSMDIAAVINNGTKLRNEKVPVNHVLCIDVSGSMYEVLSHIRTQLKSKLLDIVGDNDTVTLIWFCEIGDFAGKLMTLKSVADLREFCKNVDKFIVPRGCTNFFTPIELTNELIKDSNKSGFWNFFFMSDGGHNTGGSWKNVIKSLTDLKPMISKATICEYGYWADSNALTEMANTLGGVKVFDKDFDAYKCDFENAVKSTLSNRVEAGELKKLLSSSPKYRFFYSIGDDGEVSVYSVGEDNKLYIPEDFKELYYITPSTGKDYLKLSSPSLDKEGKRFLKATYAAIYILSDRMEYDRVEELLHATYDTDLMYMYSTSYGKQKLEDFRSVVKSRISGKTERDGYHNYPDISSNNKKYCILNLMNDLSKDESLIHLTHPEFKYNRTTAKSVEKIELDKDDLDAISKLTTKGRIEDAVKKATEKAEERQVRMRLKDPEMGYPISDMVWNSERANLSIQVRIPVILSVPNKNDNGRTEVESFIIRNYNIIKDGILNVDNLIITTKDGILRGKLKRISNWSAVNDSTNTIKIDLTYMPIVNRYMTRSVSAQKLADLEIDMLKCKCDFKYLSYLVKGIEGSGTGTQGNQVGTDDPYLKSLGITSKGYSPKTESVYSGDVYTTVSLKTKIAGFNSLPKIEDVLKKAKSGGSFTVSELFMKEAMDALDKELGSVSDLKYVKKLYKELDRVKDEKKYLSRMISSLKFSLILSRRWFTDLKPEENRVTLSNKVVTFEFTQETVKL